MIDNPGRVSDSGQSPRSSRALNSYDVVRLGYLVFGNSTSEGSSYLISFDDWDLLTLMAPIRRLTHLWNRRVKVFPIEVKHGVATISTEPKMLHIDDPRLQRISWWRVSSRSIE
ncbi:hypothetical protein Gpo141_00013939 [Globisporangium polare]